MIYYFIAWYLAGLVPAIIISMCEDDTLTIGDLFFLLFWGLFGLVTLAYVTWHLANQYVGKYSKIVIWRKK